MCVEHGDDEEAIARTVGVIAGVGLGAVSKYADDVADLTDDTLGSVYKKKTAFEYARKAMGNLPAISK